MIKKPKYCLITHTDLDGVGCAILARKAFESVDVYYCGYKEVDECVTRVIENRKDLSYTKIFITDISIQKETADLIKKEQCENLVILLDHHETALWLNKYSFAFVTEELSGRKTCGTELFYRHLLGKYLLACLAERELVEAIRCYDTWEWKEKKVQHAKDLNDYLSALGRADFVAWALETNGVLEPEQYRLLSILAKNRRQYAVEKLDTIKLIKFDKYTIGVVFADQYTSEVGSYICENMPKIDCVMIVNIAHKTMSFRTIKDDCPVNKIAKHFNGGGHPKSAGAPIDKALLCKIINKL